MMKHNLSLQILLPLLASSMLCIKSQVPHVTSIELIGLYPSVCLSMCEILIICVCVCMVFVYTGYKHYICLFMLLLVEGALLIDLKNNFILNKLLN